MDLAPIEHKPLLPSRERDKSPDDLLSRDDIESETDGGLTRRWLELAAHKGGGPPMIRLSRRMVRYRRRDFEAWLAARTVFPNETNE